MAKLKDGFYKQTAEAIGSDLHVLLAGGGSKALSDFATSTGVVTALGTSGNYVTWTKNGTVNNLVVPYAAVAEGISGIYSAGLPTSFSTGRVTHHYNILLGTEGLFHNTDNANSILTVNRHAGNYLSQLGFSSDKRLYFRSASAADINSIAWNKIAYTSEIPTKTSQLTNDSGYVTGGPYLPLAGGNMANAATIKFTANGGIIQTTATTHNAVSIISWYKGTSKDANYNHSAQIGWYNMGDTDGAMYLVPNPQNAEPWGGTVGLFIGKNTLKWNNQGIIHSGNIGSQSVNYATSSGSATNDVDGNAIKTTYLRQVVVPNNTTNDFNTFANMTLTGRVDPTTGASLVNAPWTGMGPAGGYGVLTYLFNGSGYGTQMAWGYNSNRIYIRPRYYYSNGYKWATTWDSLALASDIPTKVSQLTNDSGYITSSDIPSSLKNPNSISFKNAAGTTVSYDGSGALDLTGGIYYAVNASKASTLDCFTRRATANCTWGTLTASNGYTPIYWGDSASSGGIGFSDKGGQTFMQIDGDYYAQEGAYKVWHAGNLTKVSQLSNDAGYLTSLPSHVHTYIQSKDNYTFTASTLPNSFDWGVSAGFVADNAGYGSYGSVLTVRTYTGGGGTLQLYAPYSKTYGGTRLKARFGDYDKSNGNSWTDLKEIAWTSDIPSVGNGTVAINQGGTRKGSFTLNQSTAATINLSDTNYYPTAFSWTGGTAAGPTGSLTGVGMSAVSFGAIPAASSTASGIVTTGNQSFSGQKTFNTFVLANYITPISNTTGCGIGTSAWRYYEGYFKNLYTTYIYMYPRTYSGTLYLTGLKDAPSTTSTVDSQLYASSYVKVQNSASSSAAVYAPGGFYESSDERLKNLLKPVRVDLDELSKLRKVYYTWKNSSDLGIHLGIVAQDVQKLYPELVTVDSETGYLSLSYDKLSVIALEAIDTLYKSYKELKRRVDTLEKLITNKGIL